MVMNYNDREGHHLQSDHEPKCYNQVRYSYTNIYTYFLCALCAFWYIFKYNSCVCGYNILTIHFHLVLIYRRPSTDLQEAIFTQKYNIFMTCSLPLDT